MERFPDSSPLLSDQEALNARFASEGYVFLRGLLPAADVLDVRAGLLDVVAAAGWLAEGSDPADALPGPRAYFEPEPDYFHMYRNLQAVEAFHRLAHDPAITAVLDGIVGGDLLVHPRKIGRVSFPGCDLGLTPPHQDFPYIQGTPDTITAWVPLGAYAVGQGGLRLLPGSQVEGLRPMFPIPGVGGLGVSVTYDAPGWATTDYEPGDVLLFHSFTVHGSMPNEAERLRLSADFRYQCARDVCAPETLGPHYGDQMPPWDELTQGWSSRAWIAARDGIPTKPYDPVEELVVDDPPRLVETRVPAPTS